MAKRPGFKRRAFTLPSTGKVKDDPTCFRCAKVCWELKQRGKVKLCTDCAAVFDRAGKSDPKGTA